MKRCPHARCDGYADDDSPFCHAHRYVSGRPRVVAAHPIGIVAVLIACLTVIALACLVVQIVVDGTVN